MVTRVLKYIIFGFFSVLSCSEDNSRPSDEFTNESNQLLILLNEYRTDAKFSPLVNDPFLHSLALEHSKNMANGSINFGHDGFDERTQAILKKYKAGKIAENVAKGGSNLQGIVDMWLASSGHKKNIEGNYSFSGIGIAKGSDGMYYYTQIFIQNK